MFGEAPDVYLEHNVIRNVTCFACREAGVNAELEKAELLPPRPNDEEASPSYRPGHRRRRPAAAAGAVRPRRAHAALGSARPARRRLRPRLRPSHGLQPEPGVLYDRPQTGRHSG